MVLAIAQISSIFKCRLLGSGAEARVGFDFLIVFSTLAVCFFLGAPRSLEKERMCGLSALFYLSFRLEKGEVTPHS